MANFKNVALLLVVYALFTAGLGQDSQGTNVSQGGTHETQGGTDVSQGGAHETQDGTDVSQGGTHESQGGAHETQGGTDVSQGGAHESQGGAHETQGRVRRQAVQGPGNQGLVEWTSCDFTAASKISCYDCNTRVICKPVGGILKPCGPQRPFCNNGICSTVPSPECA